MNKILDMIAQWSGLGQAVFFLLVLSSLSGIVISIAKYIAVSIRGWPPCEESVKEDEEDED